MSEHRTEFEELMAGKALGELDAAELERLAELGERFGGIETDDLEVLAGELTAALVPPDEEDLPAALRDKIAEAAERELRSDSKGPDLRVVSGSGPGTASPSAPAGPGLMAWSGWAVAAVMAALWLGGVGGPNPGPEAPAAPNPAELRAELTEGDVDAVEIAWTATEDPAAAGASGDLVWSNETQSGVMRFVGLEPNDPNQLRYSCGSSTGREMSGIRSTAGCSTWSQARRRCWCPSTHGSRLVSRRCLR